MPPQLPAPATHAELRVRLLQPIRSGSLLRRGVTTSVVGGSRGFKASKHDSLVLLRQQIRRRSSLRRGVDSLFNLSAVLKSKQSSVSAVLLKSNSWSRSVRNSSRVLVNSLFVAFNPWSRSTELVHPSSIAGADPVKWKQFRGAVAEIDLPPPPQSQPNFAVKKHLQSKPSRRMQTHSSAYSELQSEILQESSDLDSVRFLILCFVLDLRCMSPPLLRECSAVIEACAEYAEVINTGNQYIFNTQSKYPSAESSDCKSFAKLFEEFFDKLTNIPALLHVSKTGKAKAKEGDDVNVKVKEKQRTTPSVVVYTKNGDRLVGQIAKREAIVNPENTFFSVKRFIGKQMAEVDEESKHVSYNVIRDENGNVKLDCPAIGK